MSPPEWLTVPAAPVAVGSAAAVRAAQQRMCQLGVLAHPQFAERYQHAARADVKRGMSMICHEIIVPSRCTSGVPLDRHRLDIALSQGRHAAERAKLAGCQMLLCRGVSEDSDRMIGSPLDPVPIDHAAAYARLHQLARFELVALTGALLAGAQMGLYLAPHGQTAQLATQWALALHSGVGDWLHDTVGGLPQTSAYSWRPLRSANAADRPRQRVRHSASDRRR